MPFYVSEPRGREHIPFRDVDDAYIASDSDEEDDNANERLEALADDVNEHVLEALSTCQSKQLCANFSEILPKMS